MYKTASGTNNPKYDCKFKRRVQNKKSKTQKLYKNHKNKRLLSCFSVSNLYVLCLGHVFSHSGYDAPNSYLDFIMLPMSKWMKYSQGIEP